jgi:hypothetical protein
MGVHELSANERQSLSNYANNSTVDPMHRRIAMLRLRREKELNLARRGIQTLHDA